MTAASTTGNGLLIPADAPFSAGQQVWLAGFLAGVSSARRNTAAKPAATVTVEVLYGSQTGNSERVAEDVVAALRAQGLGGTARVLDDVSLEDLAAMQRVLVVTSTYGEGEMPDNAELFWEALASPTAPRLEGLRFSVLALGDSGYDEFCQAGRLFDLRFEQLGATRVAPRVDCDVEFEDPAAEWTGRVVGLLAAEAGSAPVPAPAAPVRRERSKWNRKNPYPSRLRVNRVLSGAGSAKEIRHLELDLAGSGIEYAAGDALAVVPRNSPALVDALLAELGFDPDQDVSGVPLREQLGSHWEISAPSKDLVARLAERHPDSELAAVIAHDDKGLLENWLWGRDVLDLLRLHPDHGVDVDALAGLVRPLTHRAYSISSSPLASPDRIHLTVAAVRHGTEREHLGVCSTYLADRLGEDDPVGIFLQPNAAFRLPADDDAPVVMIGPGTGIAPFRAFLQERAGRGAGGRNWLFFGDQHRADDFIYADELEEFQASGVLTRLDLAFSRDQAEKVYVQTRMRENSKELFSWLEDGGSVFVCGDASRMARDVDAALHDVVAEHRGRGADDAAAYVNDLKRSKRYVRDVY
ncbi:diflavin oxidoreductase [Kineococcus rhizosphaerae]|uniref:assimilatory sulfite reductase (NADPH) n=1 Tax=Kineococcus rhizosphaerae TaxID=559628 RepID=A0A2T0R327_9ACTN|nr:flavodoxin domain-containing protein [Kineococcus rhizosphaerae]PRY14468.1 NAD(P)H-dependent nitrite reductase flavoprotein subunit [Kineococcus rhizosphaerae]